MFSWSQKHRLLISFCFRLVSRVLSDSHTARLVHVCVRVVAKFSSTSYRNDTAFTRHTSVLRPTKLRYPPYFRTHIRCLRYRTLCCTWTLLRSSLLVSSFRLSSVLLGLFKAYIVILRLCYGFFSFHFVLIFFLPFKRIHEDEKYYSIVLYIHEVIFHSIFLIPSYLSRVWIH